MKVKGVLQVGDSINSHGVTIKIGKILFQDAFEGYAPEYNGYYDIEFEDEKGKYHHWKSNLDGGEIILGSNTTKLLKYQLALKNTISFLFTLKDLKVVSIEASKSGSIKYTLMYEGKKTYSAMANSNFEIISSVAKLTPDLAMLNSKLREDINSVISLNSNIGGIKFSIGHGIKHFTNLRISKTSNKEDNIILS